MRKTPIFLFACCAWAISGCSKQSAVAPQDTADPSRNASQMVEKIKNDPKMDEGRKQLEMKTLENSPFFRAKQDQEAQHR